MAGAGSGRLDRGDRRGLCDVHGGSGRAAAGTGGDVEQRVVLAFGVCGDQLHAELGVCLLRCDRLVAGCVCFGDVFAENTRSRWRIRKAEFLSCPDEL